MPTGWKPYRSQWDKRVPEPWTDEQWDSWSPVKQQAMFELWDEISYLDHRDQRPGNAEKLDYALALYERALA